MGDLKQNKAFKLDVVSVRLVKDTPLLSDISITSPEDALNLVGEHLCEMDREIVCVVNLRTDGSPINCNYASVGTINQTIAHPRELLKTAILSNASKMIMIHNHPSGTLTPSREDTQLTDRMAQLCEQIGIPLLDHIIVGGDNKEYFSFREKDILPNSSKKYCSNYKLLELPEIKVAEGASEDDDEIFFSRGR